MKLYEVGISIPYWRGGDYNGSWSTEFVKKQFTTKQKAEEFIRTYPVPKYGKPHTLYAPYEITIE